MNAPDFAAILEDVSVDGWHPLWGPYPDAVLAAKVPELCQTCDGVGHLSPATGAPQAAYGRKCPDCPTIAHLLAIGAAVMKLETEDNCITVYGDPLPKPVGVAANLLRDLRAVQP